MDLREQIRSAPMRPLQWGIALTCIVLSIIDGYEILVMALVAPSLADQWDLSDVTLGYLLSAGLVGMALGAVALGPLTDRLGRRRHILVCLALSAIGMALTGMATTVETLLVARAFAGLWIGAMVPSLNCMVSEYCSDSRRGTVMGIYGVGLPAGMVSGGLVTGWLIDQWGWQGPFYFSAILSGLMFVITLYVLPESVEYLVERRPPGALHQYNKIAGRFGHEASAQLPRPRGRAAGKPALRSVFTGTLLKRTVLLWSSYALVIAAFYFANSWTPKMIADATGSAADGRTVAILISVGGIVGSLVFAMLSIRWPARTVTAVLAAVGLPVYVLFAAVYTTQIAKAIAIAVGVVTIGAIAAIYAISPYIYPAANRGAAVGFMIGCGRSVSIAIPILVGYLLDTGWAPASILQLSGVAMLAMAALVYGLHLSYRGRTEDPELVIAEDALRRAGGLTSCTTKAATHP
ncbi:MFS transporter [Nocardia cyriacigeorgica]|uniref:MFS transporter n=1 Tax=Nocardia cyriacigeorgica TaxID=135487 RepID=A0A6P1D0G8_9NOCA|nr:MFS transporter [Nocardia cyriacigeorgica]NEW36035.1 MFS transporter [Nocardia cyriacigeorgica]